MDMKKKYMKPSIVVEKAVLPAIMDTISAGRLEFGGGTGDTGSGSGFVIESKSMYYDCFGTFDTYDEDDEY